MNGLDSRSDLDLSVSNPRSTSKSMGRQKRSGVEPGGRSEIPRKRIKMRDLESVMCSKGSETRHSESLTTKDATAHAHLSNKVETFQFTEVPVSVLSDGLTGVTTCPNALSLLGDAACLNLGLDCSNPMNLKTRAQFANQPNNNATSSNADGVSKPSLPTKLDKDLDLNVISSSGLGVDLNSEDVPTIVDQNPFYPYKSLVHEKSKEASECGSTTGPLEENEPLRVWKAMKQNGFLSCSHGGIPIPKRHGQSRKSKNDVLKRKIEIAKRAQVNMVTKIAGPSGLLTGLNPGIINHVRNSKQVHSIIEAIVKSERLDNQYQDRSSNQLRRDSKEINDRKKDGGNIQDLGAGQLGLSCQDGDTKFLNRMSIPSSLDYKGGVYWSDNADKNVYHEASNSSRFKSEGEADTHTLKLSSSLTMASENASCGSSEEFSANQESINSLSVKAATVASQWLELLHQDIRGRLSALRRSKKRVRTTIQRELPSLMTREFLSNQENDPYFGQSSGSGCSKDANPNMHLARWRSLFNQMEKALSEEGKHLESWLKQVKAMQSHCELGLQFVNIPGTDGFQHLDPSGKDSRSNKAEVLDRECAVRAAAASIYSTCNLVMTAENVSCF
ncbi:uncharacterized protein LOC143884818 [Tasmannia lanceolata]|uniref:uncharacterized protein LOC143884818 n=1 Tax=Tasmannia lanceolata TaxID=3420 RepID=UPI0040641892